MDLARRVYSRELKLAAMREIDSGHTISEVAGKDSLFGLCPHFPFHFSPARSFGGTRFRHMSRRPEPSLVGLEEASGVAPAMQHGDDLTGVLSG